MRNFILLCALLLTQCVFAEPLPVEIHKIEASLFSSEEVRPELDSHWIHQIISVDREKKLIQLEDGSEWDIGWWWQSVLKTWEEGDQVSLSYDLNSSIHFVELYNRTKNEAAWGNIQTKPSLDSPHLKWIQSIENHFETVELNDGLRLHCNYDHISQFAFYCENQIVITISLKGTDTPYSLWNISNGYIAFNLKLDEEPEPVAEEDLSLEIC